MAHRLNGPPHILKDKPTYHNGGQKMSEIERAYTERRSGKDRRKIFSFGRFSYKGQERRVQQDRRSQEERRDGYVKIGKWSSVKMQDLKLAKYLRPHWKLFKFAWKLSLIRHTTITNKPYLCTSISIFRATNLVYKPKGNLFPIYFFTNAMAWNFSFIKRLTL